jgi:hypothetical protein
MSSIPPTQGSRNSLLTSTTAAIKREVVFTFAARLHRLRGAVGMVAVLFAEVTAAR